MGWGGGRSAKKLARRLSGAQIVHAFLKDKALIWRLVRIGGGGGCRGERMEIVFWPGKKMARTGERGVDYARGIGAVELWVFGAPSPLPPIYFIIFYRVVVSIRLTDAVPIF